MSESLEQKLKQSTAQSQSGHANNSNTHNTNNTNNTTIDSYVEPEKKQGIFKTAVKSIFTAGVVAATIPIVGMNSIYSTIGNGIGYLIEKKKNKEKFKSSEFLKELRTGAVMGIVGTGIYTAIDKVPVESIVSPLQSAAPKYYSIIKNIVKTLAFNPGLLIPYLAFYKGFTYLRDNFKKMKAKKAQTGEGIMKQTYKQGIKKDFGKGVGQLFKLFPIHYANVNYITNVPTRIMVGVANDIFFRLFQKKAPKQAEYHPQPQYQTQPANYSSSYLPSYSSGRNYAFNNSINSKMPNVAAGYA